MYLAAVLMAHKTVCWKCSQRSYNWLCVCNYLSCKYCAWCWQTGRVENWVVWLATILVIYIKYRVVHQSKMPLYIIACLKKFRFYPGNIHSPHKQLIEKRRAMDHHLEVYSDLDYLPKGFHCTAYEYVWLAQLRVCVGVCVLWFILHSHLFQQTYFQT